MSAALLDAELAHRAMVPGWVRLSVAELGERFAALGYRLDRSADCRGMARWMTGPRAGASYPTVTTSVAEADTGLSAFSVLARRDERFRAMQELRSQVFAVSRGAILEV